ncbi:MAG: sensor histidine kinase [Spirochaetaceae bacterium]|nr:sensor histidine kinase [Spirochaetaceae bacterium]
MKEESPKIDTIFSKFLIVFTIAIVFMVSAIIVFNYYINIKSNIEILSKQTVSKTSDTVATYMEAIMQMGNATENYVSNPSLYSDEEIKIRLSSMIDSRSDIMTIDFFDSHGNVIAGTTDKNLRPAVEICSQNWFVRALAGNGNSYFSSPHVQQLLILRYPWVLSYSKKINYTDNNDDLKQGIILIDIKYEKIKELIESIDIGTGGYLYIIDNDGKLVIHPKQTLINANLFSEDLSNNNEKIYGSFNVNYNGQNKFVDIQTIDWTRWRVVGVVPIGAMITVGIKSFVIIILIVLLLSLALTIFIGRFLSNIITSPIRHLEKEMEAIDIINTTPRQLEKGSYEVKALSHSFVEMSKRIRSLMDEIVSEQEQKRKSELDALQAKINPHFLYNTLDSVIWLADAGDDEGVIKLVSALAKLFRISISKGHEIITLEEEVEHVRNYLIIQQMRYVDKFTYNIEIPDNLRHKPTIKLILQPIVENSIYHGIKYLMDPGIINIKVEEAGNDIKIHISDNGIGMDNETRLSLLIVDKNQHIKDGNGIGVYNVNKRLQLKYGEKYGLKIESEIEEGTHVIITLPNDKDIPSIKAKQI